MLEAEVSRGNIPREVMNDPVLLEKLPAFFRTLAHTFPDEKTVPLERNWQVACDGIQ